MDTDTGSKLIKGDKTQQILGSALEGLNVLGHGFLEKACAMNVFPKPPILIRVDPCLSVVDLSCEVCDDN